MPQGLAGPGQNLPLVNLYPSPLYNAPFTSDGNRISLAPGETYVIPATGNGGWWLEGGAYCVLQYFDPINQIWMGFSSVRRGPMRVVSDGTNFRIANLTGCPIAAVVTNGGSGYVQATTTVTPTTGNSTWQPIVGGSVSITVVSAGAGYTVPPLLAIDPPPAPGVQATALATISSGTISGITNINMGAGYTSNPKVAVIPCPSDPAFISGSITNGTAGAAIISANQGKVIAVLCTNPGQPISAAPTLTVGGAGTTCTVSAIWMSSATSITVTASGGAVLANNNLVSVGGRTSATSAFTPGNPSVELTGYIPRPASMVLTVASATLTGAITATYDSGLFTGTPTGLLLTPSIGTITTVAFIQGGVNDLIALQPT